jgi:hypothetical protein
MEEKSSARMRQKNTRPAPVPAILTVLIIAAMTALSVTVGDREVIFPEIAALALGYLCAPKRPWQVNSARMFFLISGSAVLGYLMSVCLPGSQVFRITAAYLIAQLIFLWSGTSLAPLVSAVVLPVLLRTDAISYVISAVCMTITVIAAHNFLVRYGFRKEEPYTPVPRPGKHEYLRMAVRTALVALIAVPALHFGVPFLIAPPLLVAFTELSEHWTPASPLSPAKVIGLLIACAAVGVGARYLIGMRGGYFLALAALIAAVLLMFIVYRLGIFLPPAGAVTVLAMLIPEEAVTFYVAEIAAASAVFMGLTVGMYRVRVNTGKS